MPICSCSFKEFLFYEEQEAFPLFIVGNKNYLKNYKLFFTVILREVEQILDNNKGVTASKKASDLS